MVKTAGLGKISNDDTNIESFVCTNSKPHIGAWDQNHPAADLRYCGSGALQDDHQHSPQWYSWHHIIVVESDKEAEESSTDDDMPNLEAAAGKDGTQAESIGEEDQECSQLHLSWNGILHSIPWKIRDFHISLRLRMFRTNNFWVLDWFGIVWFPCRERATGQSPPRRERLCSVDVLPGHTRVLLGPRWSRSRPSTRVFVRHVGGVVQEDSWRGSEVVMCECILFDRTLQSSLGWGGLDTQCNLVKELLLWYINRFSTITIMDTCSCMYGDAHRHRYSSLQCAFDVLGFDAFIRIVLVFFLSSTIDWASLTAPALYFSCLFIIFLTSLLYSFYQNARDRSILWIYFFAPVWYHSILRV